MFHNKISTKIFIDTLFLGVLFAGAFFVIDAILPGFLSLIIPTGVVIGGVLLLALLAALYKNSQQQHINHKKTFPIIFSLVSVPFFVIATSNFPLIVRIIIVICSTLILFFILENTISDDSQAISSSSDAHNPPN